MALELRIAGPGLEVARRLEPGSAALILGRDAECGVCLPDPERNVSRRHLSVWNEADELHFHVLSVVNGVDMPFGDAPPGARGILPAGQTLKLAEYSLTVEVITGDRPVLDDDPWEALDRSSVGFEPTQPGIPPETRPDADPFGDWGFGDTFGTESAGAGGLQASTLNVAKDISAFFRGLGIEPEKVGVLTDGELEAAGRLARSAMLGILELHASVSGAKQELRSEDRTMLAPKGEKNPLKESTLPEQVALHYLFGGHMAAAGYMGPERALREVLVDLVVHQKATSAAVRASMENALKEFDPEAIKDRLLGGGSRLFESARAWDAYAKDYAGKKEDLAQWAQRLVDKYFAGAYIREANRVKRDTGSGKA